MDTEANNGSAHAREKLRDNSLITARGESVSGTSGRLVVCDTLSGHEFITHRSTVIPYPGQPRKHFPPREIEKLKESLAAKGQLMPIIVTPYLDERDNTLHFMIVDGEMRYRASAEAGITDLLIVVHSHLTEGDLYEAAATTHEDSTQLQILDRVLMLAQLYELANARHLASKEERLGVAEHARANNVSHQDIHYGLRIKELPPRLLELCMEDIVAYSGLVYLMNRKQEYDEGFPGDKVAELVESAITKQKKTGKKPYFPEKEIQTIFLRALIATGRGDEAVALEKKERLNRAVQGFRRAAKDTAELFDLIDDDSADPAIVQLLAGKTPQGFEDLETITRELSTHLSSFARLLAVASWVRNESRLKA